MNKNVFVFRTDSGARSLYYTAMEVFPLNFEHLSMISHALSTSGRLGDKFVSTIE